MVDGISFDFDVDTRRLERAFTAPDDVGAVVRTHYELDRCLTHILAKFFAQPKKLGASRVNPKLERLEALGFQGARINLARAIDDIRNDFVHREVEELRDADLQKIERLFGAITGGSSEIHDFALHLFGLDCRYAELDRRKKFVVIASMSIAALAALPHEFELVFRNSERSQMS